jgi:hypothetical protein
VKQDPKTYRLRRIRDLLSIPDDRLNDCVVELVDGIRRIRDGGLPLGALDAVTWTDDGERRATAHWSGPLKWLAQRVYGDPNRFVAEEAPPTARDASALPWRTEGHPEPGPNACAVALLHHPGFPATATMGCVIPSRWLYAAGRVMRLFPDDPLPELSCPGISYPWEWVKKWAPLPDLPRGLR